MAGKIEHLEAVYDVFVGDKSRHSLETLQKSLMDKVKESLNLKINDKFFENL
jgi:hypothetical protein